MHERHLLSYAVTRSIHLIWMFFLRSPCVLLKPQIGVWSDKGLEIKDITWPEDSPSPPKGVPEKFNLKVTFLEEPPFINMDPPDEITGQCKSSKAVRCRYAPEAQLVG